MPVIAIVDDQNTNRQVFTMLAKSVTRDTTAEAFADPNTALAWIAHHRPDLIITDYRMPGMDGADFTRSVRAIAGCAATPLRRRTTSRHRCFPTSSWRASGRARPSSTAGARARR